MYGPWEDIRELRMTHSKNKPPFNLKKMASLGELGASYEELLAFERRHLVGMQVCRRSSQVNASLTTYWAGACWRYNYPNIRLHHDLVSGFPFNFCALADNVPETRRSSLSGEPPLVLQ